MTEESNEERLYEERLLFKEINCDVFEVFGRLSDGYRDLHWARFVTNELNYVEKAGSIYNELYASEIIKILFPEYYYKVRELNVSSDRKKAIMFKIVEDAQDIDLKGPVDAFELKFDEKIDNQAFFDAIALLLFFHLNDRCMRNFMYRKSDDGFAKIFNIDFELLIEDNDSEFSNDFKKFFNWIKNISSNKKEIIKLLSGHVNFENLVNDWGVTKGLYDKFFDSISQSDLNQCAENFLNRFTAENLEKIKEINAKYEENLIKERNNKEKQYPHGTNKALTANINFVESLQQSLVVA